MTRREMFNELEGIRKRIDELEELLGECKDSEEIPKEYNKEEEVKKSSEEDKNNNKKENF